MNLITFLHRREARFLPVPSLWRLARRFSILLASVAGIFSTATRAELIPANRLADWTPGVSVGVPGGIPTNRTRLIDVTQSPYLADNTGVNDTTAAIQSAINAAVAQDVVYLPAGRYRVNGIIYVSAAKSHITIRGAGNSTIIDARGNSVVFSVGPNTDYAWAQQPYAYPTSGNTVTAGLTKGSTVLVIASTSAFSPGQVIQIAVDNQTEKSAIMGGANPTISIAGYETLRRQLTRVVSKTSSSLTIFPPVHFTPHSGLAAKVNALRSQLNGFGLESLTIDCTNGVVQFPVSFKQCYGSWMKEITVYKSKNYGLSINDSLNCEIRKCSVMERNGAGSNGAGILMNHVGNSLIEDNIVYLVQPAIEINSSSTGNVVAYNFLHTLTGGNLNVNHGPHNSFNLYEGNITRAIQSDGYFGSASEETFFRNWITGTLFETGGYTFIVGLNRFTREYSLVGNILGSQGWPYGANPYSFGNPNIGNSSFSGTVAPTAGTFWADWNMTARLTSRTSNTAGVMTLNSGALKTGNFVTVRWGVNESAQFYPSSVAGNVITFSGANAILPAEGTALTVYSGSGGYQELDQDVERSTILKLNYHAWKDENLAIPAVEVIPEVLPTSLYRSAKPDWFGDLRWPAFDPTKPVLAYDSIPAGYRYLHKQAPASGVVSAPTSVKIIRQ